MSHFPTDYDAYAPTYAWARAAVPWIVEPLARAVTELPAGGAVLEIGCGTANYTRALSARRPDLAWIGLDLSAPMLRQARLRGGRASFVRGDAARALPLRRAACGLAFAVDVIHHIDDLPSFFSETARVLAPGGRFVLVTDTDETMRRRSLTRFFPELREIELRRLPDRARLTAAAAAAGLPLLDEEGAEGYSTLDDDFLRRLAAKCASAMRLISDAQHATGMARVRAAQARGERWRSCYVVLHFGRT